MALIIQNFFKQKEKELRGNFFNIKQQFLEEKSEFKCDTPSDEFITNKHL